MAHGVSFAAPIQKQIDAARKRLRQIGDPGVPLMKQIGAIIAEHCRRAFKLQQLGDIKWPERYPGMESPFINIAGALEDWNAGRAKPQLNRFQDRPALIGPGGGHLGRSLTYKMGAVVPGETAEVFVGTSMQYAALHQEGGWSEMPISDVAKQAIVEWLYKNTPKWGLRPSKRKTAHFGREGKGPKEKTENFAYSKHVEKLIYMGMWRQRVIARPFVGVVPEAEHDCQLAIRDYFKGIAS